MKESKSDVFEIKWPWTMIPLEFADEWIEYLKQNIRTGHPLHGKKVFPSCRREDTNETIIQFDIDDDGTYAIVNFSKSTTICGKKMPKTEILKSRNELNLRFKKDHIKSLDQ
ncbi:MAG: hypothetical protein HOD92_13340 [Deltaproteobacteria bacterium]|jgi:hypothetical protein|nr:hypothetical protein [Deltaproteobacteria bacterium]MBT4526094.1 hypothetical protein [Deltaproteobacteria bacterium]